MDQAEVVKISLPRQLIRELTLTHKSIRARYGFDFNWDKYYAATDSLTEVYLDIKGTLEILYYSTGSRLTM